jgi:hypothetical protein
VENDAWAARHPLPDRVCWQGRVPVKRIKTVGKVQPKVPKKKSPVLLPKDLLRELQESLGGPDAVSLEELEAMIAQAQDPEALADDDLDMDEATSEVRFQAQELAFDAMDAPTAAKARQLAERALELTRIASMRFWFWLGLERSRPKRRLRCSRRRCRRASNGWDRSSSSATRDTSGG